MNTTILLLLSLLLVCPIVALITNLVFVSRPALAARIAGYLTGFGLLVGLSLLGYLTFSHHSRVHHVLTTNSFSLLLCSLTLLVSFVVHRYSLRYMNGDRLYRRFFILLSALTFSILVMVLADNLFLFWGAWSVSNLFLVLLMVHKKEWMASKNSGALAFYTLASASVGLLVAFVIVSVNFSTSSIWVLNHQYSAVNSSSLSISMGLVLIAALIQSGLFPFHRWLISSLNSPTPVSALMHAGLVNGGGILIVKFAPIIVMHQGLLIILFLLGALSAFLGTIWKLMQHDIKRMLACSTMAQMGFMMMQCGLGLFAAAIAHLCWHGLFKAYLFLSSGSAVSQTKSGRQSIKPSLTQLVSSMMGGFAAMICFALISNKSFSFVEPSAFVLFFAFIAGAQLMLTWMRSYQTLSSLVIGLLLAAFCGLIYGASIHLIEGLLPHIASIKAPHLSSVHWAIMALFGALWVAFNLGIYNKISQSTIGCWLYMKLFNASQPSPKTITALRNDYNY